MTYREKYELWLESDIIDAQTKSELLSLNEEEIKDRFYKDLEFGTGGLRGKMGAGTNRMNVYTVRKATQGLAMEILASKADVDRGVVIAYDSRCNSAEFAKDAAKVLCANGIKTYIFDTLRPTPELSFAVRYLGCIRGIVITASHNPKEYNGYKVYGDDGGQITPEIAERIIGYINDIDIFKDIKLNGKMSPTVISEEVDKAYIDAVGAQSFNVNIPKNFKVIYTPIHGSGNVLVQRILKKIGVAKLFVVPEQEKPDGNFPTVDSPNPENAEAFDIATKYAQEQNADLILGTDPDSDRIGVVVKNPHGKYEVLSGNQTGTLLCEYILRKSKEYAILPEHSAVVKTIVTTEMIRGIAEDYGVSVIDVLTGFKFIGEKIKEFELAGEAEKYMFGLEESFGYLKGTYARDKDAVVSAMLITEMAAEYKNNGKTLYAALYDLYDKYGYYKESLKTKTIDGITGRQKIKDIMAYFRETEISVRIKEKIDYSLGVDNLPKSDVLKFILDDGWFAIRPSGTEPKIKFYFGIKAETNKLADEKLNNLCSIIMKTVEEII